MAELAGSDFHNLRVLLGHPWANELLSVSEAWARRLPGRVPAKLKLFGPEGRAEIRSIRLGAEFDEVELLTDGIEYRWLAVPDEAPVPPVLRGFLMGVAAERSSALGAAARQTCNCVRVDGLAGGTILVPQERPCPVHGEFPGSPVGEVWSKQWAELVGRLPIEQAVHVRAVTEEWCEELTGHVDELSFPVYQHRGAVVVAAVKLGEDPGGDTIAVHERSDTLGPLVGPDDLFVFRWISPPVPVPAAVREVLRGG